MTREGIGSTNVDGLLKIELFDKKKQEKVSEVKTHNFISHDVKEYFFKTAINSLYTRGRAGGTKSPYDVLGDPYGMIILTDAKHEEDPLTEKYIKGNVIGSATSSKSFAVGTGKYRGTINESESYVRDNRAHLVFDFQTHVGNGDIGSIYFGFLEAGFKNMNKGLFGKLPDTVDVEKILSMAVIGDKLYTLKKQGFYETDIEVYNKSTGVLEKTITNYVDFGLSGSDNPSSLTSKGDLLYVPIKYKNVYTYNTKTGEILDTGKKTLKTLCYNKDKDIFASVDEPAKSTYLKTINFYDTELNLIETKTVDMGFNDEMTRVESTYPGKQNFTYKDGRYFLGEAIVREREDGVLELLPSQGYEKYAMYDERRYITTDGYLVPYIEIGSRAKLPQVVTKTATNTMKITYDFVLPTIGG